ELFSAALAAQGVPTTRVDWRPAAAGHGLAVLWSEAVDAANRQALESLLTAHQVLVDVRPAIEVVPGLTRETVLHAGPPIGAYAAEVLDRLRWFRDVLGPALGMAIRGAGGVDIRALIGQAVQMGDECHNRNRAASALLIKALAPEIAALDLPATERARILAFA